MDMSEEFDFENRIMTTSYTREDSGTDTSLRPKTLEDYIGQDKVKENLKIQKIKYFSICFSVEKLKYDLNYTHPEIAYIIRPFGRYLSNSKFELLK